MVTRGGFRLMAVVVMGVAVMVAMGCGSGETEDDGDAPDSGVDIVDAAFEAAEDSEFMAVVALVNGAEIPGASISAQLAGSAASFAAMPELADIGTSPTARGVLDALIEMELGYQEAVSLGLGCSDEDARLLAEENLDAASPEVMEALAEGYGVAVEDLASDPTVLDGYSKQCALSRLRVSITPPEVRSSGDDVGDIWRTFLSSLRGGAEIEILDPSLQ